MSILNFCLVFMDLNILATIEKITLTNMLGSIPHQKFCFYHLPTRGRARIKLGDAWYVSNVSIIFDCAMLLYYLFWMFMGFIIHFYITFGTNLLTGGPARIAVFFAYFSVSQKRNIKQSPNGMKPSGKLYPGCYRLPPPAECLNGSRLVFGGYGGFWRRNSWSILLLNVFRVYGHI